MLSILGLFQILLNRYCIVYYMSVFEDYIRNIDFRELLSGFDASYIEAIIEQIKYFTERGAERRDQIVLSYFGERSIERIVESVVRYLSSPPKLRSEARILDVGAGSEFFTVKIADKLRRYMPNASFYAMDITPSMLRVLKRKTGKVIPFLGVAEDIAGGIKYARRYMEIPEKFDALFSILTLHHCIDVEF